MTTETDLPVHRPIGVFQVYDDHPADECWEVCNNRGRLVATCVGAAAARYPEPFRDHDITPKGSTSCP